MAESADKYSQLLQDHGIRPTALRIFIYKAMEQLRYPFSLSDIANVLDTVDKSTIFRTLTLFASKHIVHEVEDGSGSMKYCLRCIADGDEDAVKCHFFCVSCHKTFCLDAARIPEITCPDGFVTSEMDFLLKGLCPDCAKKQARN